MHDDDEDYIDFPGLIDQAMRDVVRKALEAVSTSGLPGEHHFFISFRTDFPGVKISEALKEKHPHEMTIVLQHQFWDLKIDEEKFAITLSFNNVPEKLVVPFQSMSAFADPSVKFGLQFHTFIDDELMEELLDGEEDLLERLEEEDFAPPPSKSKSKKKSDEEQTTGEVVTLDAFRKKQKKKTTSDKSKK
ncbi:MAG: ClpXP protease specificity-enhancing factor SspB [Alphaproteobacteria bacterium]|nr:ClpXP protease specificity-enhancing factor SspB [Alphaproteobacteria bacterium]